MENKMKDWEKCVAKNENYKFEYYSNSKDEWLAFEEMNEDHLMNVIKKIIREDDQLPFRITFLDNQTKKPVGGQYVNLIMEPCI